MCCCACLLRPSFSLRARASRPAFLVARSIAASRSPTGASALEEVEDDGAGRSRRAVWGAEEDEEAVARCGFRDGFSPCDEEDEDAACGVTRPACRQRWSAGMRSAGDASGHSSGVARALVSRQRIFASTPAGLLRSAACVAASAVPPTRLELG